MPKLLVTGFGPFPGAPENPTEALVRALAAERPESFGADALKAMVLATDYRRSWASLRRLSSSFAPDVAVHFGLDGRANEIRVECVGRNRVDTAKVDAAGYAPEASVLLARGPATRPATLATEAIVAALLRAGIAAASSDDAGAYVCNATLYRSLGLRAGTRRVGFVHVPPAGTMPPALLLAAARIILRTALGAEAGSFAAESSQSSAAK